jgi:hypothetical protein
LRAVGSRERSDSATRDAPMEVLRFATLAEDRRTLLMQVSDLLEQIDFGTVVLVMHEGKVIQMETSEKIRLSRGLPAKDDRFRSG